MPFAPRRVEKTEELPDSIKLNPRKLMIVLTELGWRYGQSESINPLIYINRNYRDITTTYITATFQGGILHVYFPIKWPKPTRFALFQPRPPVILQFSGSFYNYTLFRQALGLPAATKVLGFGNLR